jgi:DNA-binding MarR family transcriptional regulator
MANIINSSERELMRLIYSAAHKCVSFCEDIFKQYDVTFPQSVLIFLVYEHIDEDLCQKDIENKLGVKGSSITSLINNVSKKNLIERKKCDGDGRKYIIKLTDDGKKLVEKISSDYKDTNLGVFKSLNNEEKEQLMNILLKIS